MGRPKKEATLIDAAEAERLVLKLEKAQECKISVLDFVKLNIQRFKDIGLSRKTIYDNLTRGGLNLGTFNSFSGYWSRIEKSEIQPNISSESDSPAKTRIIEAETVKQSKKKRSMTCAKEKKNGKAEKRSKAT